MKSISLIGVAAAIGAATLSTSAEGYCASVDFVPLRAYLDGARAGETIPVYLVTSGTHSVLGSSANFPGFGHSAGVLSNHARFAIDVWNNAGADVSLRYAGTISESSTAQGIRIIAGGVSSIPCATSDDCDDAGGDFQVCRAGVCVETCAAASHLVPVDGSNDDKVAVCLPPAFSSGPLQFTWSMNPAVGASQVEDGVHAFHHHLAHEIGHVLGLNHISASLSPGCTISDGETDQEGLMNAGEPSSFELVEPRRADIVPLRQVWGTNIGAVVGRESANGTSWSTFSVQAGVTSTFAPAITSEYGDFSPYQSGSMAMVTTSGALAILRTLTNTTWTSADFVDASVPVFWRPAVASGNGRVMVAWLEEAESGEDYFLPMRIAEKNLATGAWTRLTTVARITPSKSIALGFDPSSGVFLISHPLPFGSEGPYRGHQTVLTGLTGNPTPTASDEYRNAALEVETVYATGRAVCTDDGCQAAYVDTSPCVAWMNSEVAGSPPAVNVTGAMGDSVCILSSDSEMALGPSGQLITSAGAGLQSKGIYLRSDFVDATPTLVQTLTTGARQVGVGSSRVVVGNTGPPFNLSIWEQRFRVLWANE